MLLSNKKYCKYTTSIENASGSSGVRLLMLVSIIRE